MATKLFLPVAVFGIFVGVLFGTLFDPLVIMFLITSLTLGALVALVIKDRKGELLFLCAVLFLFASLLGASRAWTYIESIPQTLAQFEGREVLLVGVVSADPDVRETSLRARVHVEKVNGTHTEGTVVVSTERFSSIRYGDRVSIEGTVEKPESFETETGRTFNYPKFLLAHQTTHTMSFVDVAVIEHGQGNLLLGNLINVKDLLVERIEAVLPDPQAPLLAGLLLGERQSLGNNLYESFQRAGVVHLVVLSGYNVSLVVQAILKITEALLPRLASFSVAGVGIVAFALMTGASETTIRASLMAGILILAQVLRRPHHALRALLLAGAVMVLINPYLLLYDLSFQLSFLATAGIILFADTFAKRLTFLPTSLGIREVGGATLAAQLAVLPILVASLGSVSVVSPVANVLVLVAVPWAMLFGFIASVLAFVSTWLAYPFTILSYGLLTYILKLSVWFGDLPFAALIIPPSAVIIISIGLFAIYVLLARLFMRRTVLRLPPRLGS